MAPYISACKWLKLIDLRVFERVAPDEGQPSPPRKKKKKRRRRERQKFTRCTFEYLHQLKSILISGDLNYKTLSLVCSNTSGLQKKKKKKKALQPNEVNK